MLSFLLFLWIYQATPLKYVIAKDPIAPYVNPKKPLSNPRKAKDNNTDNLHISTKANESAVANKRQVTSDIVYREQLQVEKVFANKSTVKDGFVSIRVIDCSVVDLLNIVSNKLNRKMVISSNVNEKISLQLDDVSLEQVLQIIENVTGVSWAEIEDVVIVSTSDKLSNATFFNVRYADLKSMKDKLSVFGIDDKIVINDYPRGLLISAAPITLKRIHAIVDKLDKRLPSIKVEFKVLEVNKSRERRLGISWQDASGNLNYSRVFGATKLYNYPGEIQQISTVRVPLLGKPPIIGSLFQSTQKSKSESEILVLITPTLIYPNIQNNSANKSQIPYNGEIPTDNKVAKRNEDNKETLESDMKNAVENGSISEDSKLIKKCFFESDK